MHKYGAFWQFDVSMVSIGLDIRQYSEELSEHDVNIRKCCEISRTH